MSFNKLWVIFFLGLSSLHPVHAALMSIYVLKVDHKQVILFGDFHAINDPTLQRIDAQDAILITKTIEDHHALTIIENSRRNSDRVLSDFYRLIMRESSALEAVFGTIKSFLGRTGPDQKTIDLNVQRSVPLLTAVGYLTGYQNFIFADTRPHLGSKYIYEVQRPLELGPLSVDRAKSLFRTAELDPEQTLPQFINRFFEEYTRESETEGTDAEFLTFLRREKEKIDLALRTDLGTNFSLPLAELLIGPQRETIQRSLSDLATSDAPLESLFVMNILRGLTAYHTVVVVAGDFHIQRIQKFLSTQGFTATALPVAEATAIPMPRYNRLVSDSAANAFLAAQLSFDATPSQGRLIRERTMDTASSAVDSTATAERTVKSCRKCGATSPSLRGCNGHCNPKAFYCNEKCQRADWKEHKHHCRQSK